MNTTILRQWLKDNGVRLKLTELYVPAGQSPHLVIRLDATDWSVITETEDDSFNIAIKEVKQRFSQKVPALVLPPKKQRKSKKLFP